MVTTFWRIHLFAACVFYCRHGICHSYISFCRHIGADFNGRFLAGCCCIKTNSSPYCHKLETELKVICVDLLIFLISSTNDIISAYFSRKYLIDFVSFPYRSYVRAHNAPLHGTLPIYRGHFSPNNSRKTPMAGPLGTRTVTPRTRLTHWIRVTHICVGNLTIIGPDNVLSSGRRQAIIWTNAGILLIGPRGTNFSEILIGIHTFSFKKIHLKMSSAKWRSFCLGLNVLTLDHQQQDVRLYL